MADIFYDVFQKAFSPDTQIKLAKESAIQITQRIGSKVESNRRLIIGEPYCPYKIPMHTKDFWCTVFVSDISYLFTANHRSPTKAIMRLSDFSVRLKTAEIGFPKPELVPKISDVIGTEIYTYQDGLPDDYFERRLLSKSLLALFKKIKFNPITEFTFSPLHIRVISSFRFASLCIEQTQIFQELIVSTFEQAKERQKF